jgi:pimeloyl-ACP methyl ester carboxylesterase
VRRTDFTYLDTLLRRWAPNWHGPERDGCLADAKRMFTDPRVLDAALGYYRAASPGAGGVGRIPVPGLIVGDTQDGGDVEAFSRSAAQFDAPCEVVIAGDAGHWPQHEAADLFRERLIAFLSTTFK